MEKTNVFNDVPLLTLIPLYLSKNQRDVWYDMKEPFTQISDSVSVASRVKSLAKWYNQTD
jgi:hypothetical protein